MSLPILIVSAFPGRLPNLISELKGRDHEVIKAPVGAQAKMKPNPYWRDTHNPKLITWGEVACFEGHVNAWRRAVELNKPCVILEDDAKIIRDLPSAYLSLIHI